MSIGRKAYAIWRKRRQSKNNNYTIKTLTEIHPGPPPLPQKKEEDPKVDEKEFISKVEIGLYLIFSYVLEKLSKLN